MPVDDVHDRPRLFSPGMRIGMHLQVERVVRETADRTYYLVNNARRRWYTVKCWECGNKHSPPSAQSCTYCSAPLGFRRLLMSARWDRGSVRAFQAYAHRRLKAHTLSQPVALYRYKDQLLAFFPWEGENLLVNEPAPLSRKEILLMAFQLADGVQRLHDYGVVLKGLDASHVLRSEGTMSRLFDLEVSHLVRRSIKANEDPTLPPMRDVRLLAALLDDYCPIEADGLRELLTSIRRGGASTADEMASIIGEWARRDDEEDAPSCAAALSDAGLVQRRNEDAWSWRPLREGAALYILADGVSGDLASGLAVRTVSRQARRRTGDKPLDTKRTEALLRELFTAAQQAVRGAAEVAGTAHADTTLCVAARVGAEVVVAMVGDTRALVLRGETLKLLGAADEKGSLLGSKARIQPRMERWKARAGDRLVLATRGLWSQVDADAMAQIVRDETHPRAAVRRLIRAANDAGGEDNATAIVVHI